MGPRLVVVCFAFLACGKPSAPPPTTAPEVPVSAPDAAEPVTNAPVATETDTTFVAEVAVPEPVPAAPLCARLELGVARDMQVAAGSLRFCEARANGRCFALDLDAGTLSSSEPPPPTPAREGIPRFAWDTNSHRLCLFYEEYRCNEIDLPGSVVNAAFDEKLQTLAAVSALPEGGASVALVDVASAKVKKTLPLPACPRVLEGAQPIVCLPPGTKDTPLVSADVTREGVDLCRVEGGDTACYAYTFATQAMARVARPINTSAAPVIEDQGKLTWVSDGKPLDLGGGALAAWHLDPANNAVLVSTAARDGTPATGLVFDARSHALLHSHVIGTPERPCAELDALDWRMLVRAHDCHGKNGISSTIGRDGSGLTPIGRGYAGFDHTVQALALVNDRAAFRARHGARVLVYGSSGGIYGDHDLHTTFLPGHALGADDADDGFMLARADGVEVVHGGVSQGTFVYISTRTAQTAATVEVVRASCGAPPWDKQRTIAQIIAGLCERGPLDNDGDAQIDDALPLSSGRTAIVDALDACAARPETDVPTYAWADMLTDDSFAIGITADGERVLTRAGKRVAAHAVGDDKARGTLSAEEADALGPPMLDVSHRSSTIVATNRFIYFRHAGLSFFIARRCESPDEGMPTCTLWFEARAPGQPLGLIAYSKAQVEWEPYFFGAYTRTGVPALVLTGTGGGKLSDGVKSFAVPRDVVAAVNRGALAELKEKRLVEAQRGFEAALGIAATGDVNAELPRYNLARTFALMGKAADAATALAPLVAADAKKWIAKLKADKDFAGVRDAPEIQALIKAK